MQDSLTSAPAPFLFSLQPPENLRQKLKKTGLQALERILGLNRCQQLYTRLATDCPLGEFSRQALATLGVECDIDAQLLARIPANGGCILVANHPYGGIEGLALLSLIGQIRSDFKVMGNYLLGRVPQLRAGLIQVDPFAVAARTNIGPLRQALRCLQDGQLLVVFPAGEVSSWQPRLGCVADPPWSSTLARLVRLSGCRVQPVFFPGKNGPWFQLLGQLNARLRTALLPRMMLNKRGVVLRPLIGHPLPAKKLLSQRSAGELTAYLRFRTYALATREQLSAQKPPGPEHADLAAPPPVEDLEADLQALPAAQTLLVSGDFSVYYATADQLPQLLPEIGRQREASFRQAGEGTGRARDLDEYDRDYLHLLAWDKRQRCLVGAYRIGRVDDILSRRGVSGLYTNSLFAFKPRLVAQLRDSLELGRSFICPEYQKSYASLLLLWKGIGRYLVAHPQYRYLFGPVSISGDYRDASRQLMAASLQRHYRIDALTRLVTPRFPVNLKPLQVSGAQRNGDPLLREIDDISTLVADLEDDGKGIPVLLRHYLGLGGRLLAFNRDPAFSDVIDGLLLVDLQQADKKQLQRYMGRDGYRFYLEQQEKSIACA